MAVEEIQYSTSKQWVGPSGDINLVGEIDKLRIAAYDLYDGIYHNRQESLLLQMRGEDQKPIYMPSGRKIVEATSRYLMVGFDFYAKAQGDDDEDPPEAVVNSETSDSGSAIEDYFNKFFKRERIKAKFANQKRYCLIRGDAMWYVTADPRKPQGTRLSLSELDPRHYFPIDDPDDNTRIIGCHIVDTVQDPTKPDDRNAKVARRQTYRKVANAQGSNTITSEVTCWELGKWDDRIDGAELNRIPNPEVDVILQTLPPQITQLPVYHIKNSSPPNAGFGMSELAGMETLIFAINQAITDEDLTLVMQGLGMYVTNAAAPVNSDGSTGEWSVGPGVVVELGADQEFTRVTGVTSISPYTEHATAMNEGLQQGSGTPEIAIGAVDVAVAESGVALMIQLSPILAKNAEKELDWILTTDQMFYDIVNMWLPAYEGIQPNGAEVSTIVDDPMPVNRDAKIQELILLYTSGVITLAMVVKGLMELGYSFPDNDPEKAALAITAEQKQKSIDMMGDPYANGEGGVGDEDPNAFGGESAGQIGLGQT